MIDEYQHLEDIEARMAILFSVLQYCTEQDTTFNRGERICINQERAALFEYKSYLFSEMSFEAIRKYQVPESIEQKIDECLATIKKNNWTAKDPMSPLE